MGEALRIGVVTAYPEEDWHSQQLIDAANRLGEAVVIRPEQFSAHLTPAGITLQAADVNLSTVDGFVLARGFGDQGNADFLVPVYQLLEQNGTVVVNRISALLTAIDKFETSCRLQQAGLPTPKVVVVQEAAAGQAVLSEWGRVVAKPLFGSLGLGIELLEDTPEGRARLPEMLSWFGAVYLQEYVPLPGRDIRAFVIGPRVIGSIYRVAEPGEWRTNVSRGGTPQAMELPEQLAALAVEAARAIGLDYTGVDLIEGPDGPVVIEVNGTPLWRGLAEATGRQIADAVIAWVAERIAYTVGKGGDCFAEGTNER